MRRSALALACWLLAIPRAVDAAPREAGQPRAPQRELRLAPRPRAPERAPVQPARSQQPDDRLEALHYFRERPSLPGVAHGEHDRAALEGLMTTRTHEATARRDEAMALLERFVASEPEQAREMADALLRLSELTWERARSEHLARFERWQRLPEAERSREPPRPDHTRALALYDRLIERHPGYERLDLVLYMKAFTRLEQGDEAAALPLFGRILAEFPESRFRADAHMAHAEHAFGAYDYARALAAYDQVLAHEDSALYGLALFKSAWCLWQLQQKDEAAKRFRRVLDLEGKERVGARRRQLKELQADALESLIQVFTEDEQNRAADVRRFLQEIGGERHVARVLARLSRTYYDQARFDRGIEAYALLRELDPSHAEAPRHQLAIATGYLALDRFPQALEAYRVLAVDYAPGGTWARQQSDADTVEETSAMIERALREQALSQHELGQRESDREAFTRAVALYELYLTAFPRAPESHRLTYHRAEILFHRLGRPAEAGEGYLAAAELRPDGELTKDALYNAISCFERIRQQEITRCTGSEPCAETDNDRRFARAIELYASYYPRDPELPEILYRQGRLYYDRHVYDAAVRLFGELLERFPESSYATDAGELVLDSFHRAADYENIERWARKLKRAPGFRDAAAQKRLDGLILGAAFKLGEQRAARGEHARAAEAYLAAAAEFPHDPRAPKAYYNAGLELARVGSLEAAEGAYRTLLDRYPESAEAALGALKGAEMFAAIAQFGDAARFYDAYAERFPRGDQAEAAGYDAVLLHEAAGEHEATVRAGKRYLARHASAEGSAEVTFRMGRAQAALGKKREAADTYRAFVARTRRVDQRIEASTRLGVLLVEAGDREGADAAFTSAVRDARRARDKAQAGRYFAAQARFLQGDQALRAFDAVAIEGEPAGLGQRLRAKSKRLAEAASIYGDVVSFGVAEWVTAALYKIGESYERFAKALTEAALPEGLSEAESQAYRDELASVVVPIEERALAAYEGGYRKARELGIYNAWTTRMREALTRLNEVAYPKLAEIGGGLAREATLPLPPVREGRARTKDEAR